MLVLELELELGKILKVHLGKIVKVRQYFRECEIEKGFIFSPPG